MYLASFDFEIKYYKGTDNPADSPSRRPDYEGVRGDNTWLLEFQNKIKGSFVNVVRRYLAIPEELTNSEQLALFLAKSD